MSSVDLKIAVYGAGAMGTVLGVLMTKGGVPVELVTRNVKHVRGLNERGAKITLPDGSAWEIPVTALLPEQMIGGYDLILLMTKQRQNAEIVEFLKTKLKPDGVLCTTQNGLPEEGVAKLLGAERTVGAVASFGANFIGEGCVELTSLPEAMRVQVGSYTGDSVQAKRVADILSSAGRATGNPEFALTTDNLLGARWSKLAINAAFSGLSVVTGQNFGQIAKGRRSKRIALNILRECMDVANALGVELSATQGHDLQKQLGRRGFFGTAYALLVLPMAMKKHKKLVSGMLRDVQNGKKCEIDYIDGAVVRKGKEVGVATPFCEKVVELVHGIENGLYEISPENLDFFE